MKMSAAWSVAMGLIVGTLLALAGAPLASATTQACIPNREETVPSAGEGLDEPWIVGTEAGQCACADFAYVVHTTSPDCQIGCKYTITWSFRWCMDWEQKPCYYAISPPALGNYFLRHAGAPDCCGPAALGQGDARSTNTYWDYLGFKEDFSQVSIAAETVPCDKKATLVFATQCPTYQAGQSDPGPFFAQCEASLSKWAGTVLEIAADCRPCVE